MHPVSVWSEDTARIVVTDTKLSSDPEALHRFLLSEDTAPPRFQVVCKCIAMDFHFTIDLTPILLSAARGVPHSEDPRPPLGPSRSARRSASLPLATGQPTRFILPNNIRSFRGLTLWRSGRRTPRPEVGWGVGEGDWFRWIGSPVGYVERRPVFWRCAVGGYWRGACERVEKFCRSWDQNKVFEYKRKEEGIFVEEWFRKWEQSIREGVRLAYKGDLADVGGRLGGTRSVLLATRHCGLA